MARKTVCPFSGVEFDYDNLPKLNTGMFSPAGYPLDETAVDNYNTNFGDKESQANYRNHLLDKVREFQAQLAEDYPDDSDTKPAKVTKKK